MVVVDEVLHADQEHVYSPRPFHREVLGIVPGKMEIVMISNGLMHFRKDNDKINLKALQKLG